MSPNPKKTLGQCIDELVNALKDVEDSSKIIAIKAACEHLNISLGEGIIEQGTPQGQPDIRQPQVTPPPSSQRSVMDLKTLKEEKNPSSAVEMACVVAYYLENHAPNNERKVEMTKNDIVKYFKQARFRLPKVPKQLLISAAGAGYLDSVGRGTYKLNPVGYNLVALTLPRKKRKQ